MLEVSGLTVSYGRHRALENVALHVKPGEIRVILGANGAGKSTLLKAISGLVACEPGGSISISGRMLSGEKPNRIVERGIALVPEGGAVFGELTVAENLQLGAFPERARDHESENLKRVHALFPVLSERRGQIARTMSGGEQRMLAVGRALMSRPDILMLDEPSLGLSPLLSTELFKALKAIRETGVGILLVEQNANLSLAIADHGYLLENGHIVGEDSAMALASDPAVRRAYLGADAGADEFPVHRAAVAPAATARTARSAPHGPSLAGMDAAAIAGRAPELAAHAAETYQAFIAARRHPATTASGTVAAPAPHLPQDAASLSALAPSLAEAAARRQREHLMSLRRQASTAPSLPAAKGTQPVQHDPSAASARSPLTVMAEEYARQASQPKRQLNGGAPASSFSGRGNGASLTNRPPAAAGRADALAAAAAAIQAQHVAAHRRAATQALLNHHDDEHETTARHGKRKGKKKKSKKARKRCKSKGD